MVLKKDCIQSRGDCLHLRGVLIHKSIEQKERHNDMKILSLSSFLEKENVIFAAIWWSITMLCLIKTEAKTVG